MYMYMYTCTVPQPLNSCMCTIEVGVWVQRMRLGFGAIIVRYGNVYTDKSLVHTIQYYAIRQKCEESVASIASRSNWRLSALGCSCGLSLRQLRISDRRQKSSGSLFIHFCRLCIETSPASIVSSGEDWPAELHGQFKLYNGQWHFYIPVVTVSALIKAPPKNHYGGWVEHN